jgi:hypothetical protein
VSNLDTQLNLVIRKASEDHDTLGLPQRGNDVVLCGVSGSLSSQPHASKTVRKGGRANSLDESPAAQPSLRVDTTDSALRLPSVDAASPTTTASPNSGTFPGAPKGFLSLLSTDERGLLKDVPSLVSSSPNSDPTTTPAPVAISRFASLLPAEWLDKDACISPSPRDSDAAVRLSPVEKLILSKKTQVCRGVRHVCVSVCVCMRSAALEGRLRPGFWLKLT